MTNWNAITWETARAAGLASYALLTTTVAMGLVLGSRFQSKRWPRRVTNELHGYVSLLALVFIGVHVLAIAIDPFTHFGLAGVLIPFVSHYRPLWTALGIVTLYLLAAVWVTTALRTRIGHRLWRRIHLLAFVIYAAGTLHGLGSGSDTRTVWALALYTASVTIVGSLVAARLLVPAGREARPRAAAVAGLGLVAAVAWTITGPLDGHWGKHARGAVARTAVASPTAAAKALPRAAVVAAVVDPPFTARFAGRLTVEPVDRAGRVTVRIDGALTGATNDHLEILLHGIPLDDGGVVMEQSRVRMGARTALYNGRITALRGTRLVAMLRSRQQRLRLAVDLRFSSDGTVLGNVRGTGSNQPGRAA